LPWMLIPLIGRGGKEGSTARKKKRGPLSDHEELLSKVDATKRGNSPRKKKGKGGERGEILPETLTRPGKGGKRDPVYG